MSEHLVVFMPSGRRDAVAEGTSLLDAARRIGVDLDSVCGGRGICGRCRVGVGEGVFAGHGIVSRAAHAGPRTQPEERYARLRGGLDGAWRLGCQARVAGPLVVDVPPESQRHRQVVRKDLVERIMIVDPAVRPHFVTVEPPNMMVPASDLSRLRFALERDWALVGLEIPLSILSDLQKTLRAGNWSVTAAVAGGRRLVAVYPALVERLYGLAVDVGSTTIAAHLADLSTGAVLASAGVMNPQIRFGEDLMSRISQVMLHPARVGEMAKAVREAIDGLAGSLAAEAAISRDRIVETVIVGNPVMLHLLLGIDPTELGGAPFALAFDRSQDVPARDLGLDLAPGALVHLPPCIAGHVGADAAAMVLSEAPQDRDEITLLVDVGTNAEIVVGNRHRLLACSSPTGPAFEGAQISGGQRAAPGAIERLRIDPTTFEPRYRVIGSASWSDEPGAPDLPVTGICGSGIVEAVAELFLAGLLRADGSFDQHRLGSTPRLVPDGRTLAYVIREAAPRIAITQGDVRAIQLAKAALHAGATLLMEKLGTRTLDRVVLAGGFGSHIDPVYALVLGMLPDCDVDRVVSAGNAAGTGALMLLLDAASRQVLDRLVDRIEKVETAIEPDFQRCFVDAMALPHRTDPYVRLARRVRLPPRPGPEDGSPPRRRVARA